MSRQKILVTAALPYANGPVHVGHAIGCYIPADVYTRYNRLAGNDVIYICGTDEHGTPITVTAEQEGKTEQEVVDKYHEIQEEALKSIGVEFDNFSGTSRKIHHKLSQDFFTKIDEAGFIKADTVERPYCLNCRRFLPDRYVKGTCPECKSSDQRGDQCEACGKQLEPHELLESYCVICHGKPEQRKTKHWFFKLSEFSDDLEDWIQANKDWPANARNFALGWIKEGLQDRSITRDLKWGIPVPLPEAKDKVLYVWFDAPIGYISSTKERFPKQWEGWWQDPNMKLVHFIGKDNIPFHTIIWPAVLLAYNRSLSKGDKKYILPEYIASNEFLNLEGQKVSTSRNWVIWLADIVGQFNPDAVRYYLISIAPEVHDSDFHLKEFQQKVNAELIGTLGNFINRTLSFIANKNGGVVPDPTLDERKREYEHIRTLTRTYCAREDGGLFWYLKNFKFKGGLQQLMFLAQAGNRYFQDHEPWKGDYNRTLYECVNLVARLAIFMYPFLPASAEKVWKMLNLEGSVSDKGWRDGDPSYELVKSGHKIGKVEILYDKIEDEQIETFRKKYLHVKTKKKEGKKMVDFEEFEKLDLRVGIVKNVEDHPSADKLVVLKVDVGELGEKQLVAGVKKDYSKDDLIGKRIIVVANLKPVKLRGVLSEGMLLAAVDDNKVNILTTDRESAAGAQIK